MVTASSGTITMKGRSGRTYAVAFYTADVLGTAVKFDSGSGASATSLPFWKVPEPCVLVDVAVVTGNTVTTNLVMTADGAVIPGMRLPEAAFLNTLANRPPLAIGFKQGTNFGFTEA